MRTRDARCPSLKEIPQAYSLKACVTKGNLFEQAADLLIGKSGLLHGRYSPEVNPLTIQAIKIHSKRAPRATSTSITAEYAAW